MKVLMVYPNLPMMMAPAISVAIFNAISKEYGVDFRLFETTQYADEVVNRHIKMSSYGANRGNAKDERDEEYFVVKPKDRIIPDFIELVNTYNPDVILMSMQEDVYSIGIQLLDSVKHKGIPHIIGGVFPSQAPEVVMKNDLVRCIAIHEGENTYRQLIEEWKRTGSFYSIDGIWWKDDSGNIHKNKPSSLCDISRITPDFDCYENKRWQRPMGGKHFYRAVSMETYRGCPYKCTYCNSPTTRDNSKKLDLGNFMRRKSSDIVERDLKYYIDTIGPDLIMFQDDSFLARPPKEIFDFCDMWSKYKIPFWFNTRIENCKPEYLAALKEAGVYRMTFGLESGNEEFRKTVLQRPIRNETYFEYFEYINNSDIPYSLNIIIGMPFETRDMVMDTARVVKKAGGYDGLTISMFQPYHGTALRDVAVKNGFLKSDIILNGGFLDNWFLEMPNPYLQKDEVFALSKTFALYAYYDESLWDVVRKSEVDTKLYDDLMKNYKKKFFTGDTQTGGNTRLKYCAKHDISATYHWEYRNEN